MSTVVDELIVLFKLDGSQYKKGAEDATRTQRDLQGSFKKSTESISKTLTELTRNIAIAFVGFEGVKGLLSFLTRVNQAQASLFLFSRNLGLSARSIDQFNTLLHLAGGSAEGGQNALQQLNAELTKMFSQGQPSNMLQYFAQLGVHLRDDQGRVRSSIDIYKEFFALFKKTPESYQYALSMGVPQDILQYGMASPADQQKLLKEAEEATKRTTQDNTREALKMQQQWELTQKIIEGIGKEFLEKITPTMQRLLPVVEKISLAFGDWIAGFNSEDPKNFFAKVNEQVDSLLTKLQGVRAEIGKILSGDFSDVTAAIGKSVDEDTNFTHPERAWEKLKNDPVFVKPAEDILGKIGSWFRSGIFGIDMRAAEERHNLPAGMLPAIAKRESNMDPSAVSPKGAVGIMQLMPSVFPGAGRDPRRDIEMAAAELERLHHVYGNWAKALAAYNDGQGNLANNIARGTVPKETINYVPAVINEMRRARSNAGAPAKAGDASLTINGGVTINTQATDGKAVAVDFMAEMNKRRQGLTFQVDTGMIP